MTALPVSVVICSQGRPKLLQRALLGLSQLFYHPFEIIVVADEAALDAVRNGGVGERIKTVPCTARNIAVARNLGIDHAGGDIIAFIDDDAVPEPTWLSHLVAPFENPRVGAAGGYVRGRNGISLQWAGRSFDRCAVHSPIDVAGADPVVLQGDAERGIKTEGTNCAFRAEILRKLGGFDENYAYYLDETDLNYRIGLAGHATAIVPLAQVHHDYAAGLQRHANRVPRSLYDIGASTAYFLNKHGSATIPAAFAVVMREQRNRLLRLMVRGEIAPGDVGQLLATLREGIAQGQKKPPQARSFGPKLAFQPFNAQPKSRNSIVIASRPLGWRALRKTARKAVSDGSIVTAFFLSDTALYHRVRFHPDGYWEQKGGIFGRAERSAPLFQFWRMPARVAHEMARVRSKRVPVTNP